jgi:hypothetical protein
MTTPNFHDEPELLNSRKLTAEEEFFYKTAFKEPVKSIDRLEETAKFLAAAVSASAGVFLSALRVGPEPYGMPMPGISALLAAATIVFWGISLITLLMVLLPRPYAVGRNHPDDWKETFITIRRVKYRWLMLGAGAFIIGLVVAAFPLVYSLI